VLAALGTSLFVFTDWTKSQLLDTDNWVEFVAPLPKDPAVSQGLAEYINSKVLDTAKVEARIVDALPDRADFLAPVLTTQIQQASISVTNRIISGDAFQSIWISANQAAHQRVLARATGANTEPGGRNQRFDIDLHQVRQNIASELGRSANALGVNEPSADQQLKIEADLGARPRRVSQFVKTINFLYTVLPMIILAVLLWGLVLSDNRRRTILGFGAATSVFLLLELIAVKAFRTTLLGRFNIESYQNAVAVIYDSLLASFSSTVTAWLGLAILVWVIAWLSGPGRLGLRLRKLIRSDDVVESGAYGEWRYTRLWFAQQKYYFWTIIFMIALFYLAFVININREVALNTLFAVVAAVGFIELLATPPYLIKGRHKNNPNHLRNRTVRRRV
jgi:hypothetical protein